MTVVPSYISHIEWIYILSFFPFSFFKRQTLLLCGDPFLELETLNMLTLFWCAVHLTALTTSLTKNAAFSKLGKNCVRICIQNLLHISADVSGPLLAEVAVAVFSFIRDTYVINSTLFNEFDTNSGYKALENILTR